MPTHENSIWKAMTEAVKKRARSAQKTKERILEAAKATFSKKGYDQSGLRLIAKAAGVDAALVSRYFGSKENLFREAVASLFTANPPPEHPMDNYARGILEQLKHRLGDGAAKEKGIDPFQVLLRSAVSPVASPILAEVLDKVFIEALMKRLPGENKRLRAGLVSAYVLGFLTMQVAFKPEYMDLEKDFNDILRFFDPAIKACLEG